MSPHINHTKLRRMLRSHDEATRQFQTLGELLREAQDSRRQIENLVLPTARGDVQTLDTLVVMTKDELERRGVSRELVREGIEHRSRAEELQQRMQAEGVAFAAQGQLVARLRTFAGV